MNLHPFATPTLVASALLVLLGACTSPAPWPEAPAAAARPATQAPPCPSVAGLYLNASETPGACSALDARACRSLSYYLFSAHVAEAAGVSNYPTAADDWPAGSQVRIEQPTADTVRVTSLNLAASGEAVTLATRVLDRRSGAFACEGNSLRLKPRIERDAQLWAGRRTHTEYLALSLVQGQLEVHSTRHYEPYLLWMVGGTMREERSRLRWSRVP
ncbi:MAG: hypothetical protein CFE45_26680 [Burkholderiales bacterium PBB5]|nr:MAG: hypothetical protein CFE45_26680 [Burkholderiales bacterium PBB5]